MSVSSTVQLPNNPDSGAVDLVPLGGDGFSSPISLYIVKVDLDSDAGGGNNRITIRFDVRYTSIVSYASLQITSGAAAIGARLEIRTNGDENVAIQQELPVVSVSGSNTTNAMLWTPPALMVSAAHSATETDPPVLRGTIDNTDTESQILTARIYNFDKRARELAPLHVLLASLTRSVGSV